MTAPAGASPEAGAPNNPESARRSARRAARLAAVQALYQMELSGSTPQAAMQDIRAGRLPALETGPADVDVDSDLFARIVEGAVAQQGAVDTAIARALSQGWRLERIDAVARAVLRAGLVELWSDSATPQAVVISEFVEVSKGFFEGPEPGFINAALDAAARAVRPEG